MQFRNFQGANKAPAYRAPLVEPAPNLDGDMDAAYRQAEPMTLVFLTGKPAKPQAPTKAWAVCTKEALYFFFECRITSPAGAASSRRTRDSDVWSDNCVEVFLDPTGAGSSKYYQVNVNSRGAVADAYGRDQKAWNPDLKIATKVLADRWTAEIAVPFAELGLRPESMNKLWRMNATRLSLSPSEDTSWIAIGGYTAHVPSQFGYLWVDAGNTLNAAPQRMVPWVNLFNGRDLSGWTVAGKCSVRDGLIVTGEGETARLVLKGPAYEGDFVIGCDTMFMGQARFLFARDADNRQMGYMTAFINPINEINVAMMRNWEFYTNPWGFHGTIYKYTGGQINDNTWYRLEVQVRRDHIILTANGREYLEMANPYPDARWLGLVVNANAKVKNVQMRTLVK